MSDEPHVPAGTKDDPLLIWQGHYKTCGHTIISPRPATGQSYRIVGFLDFGGRCRACKEAKMKEREAARQPKITAPCPEPDCKGTLVERTNRATGEAFLGCSEYPTCRYTRPLTEYLRMKKAGAPTLF